jgi:predicted DCC family thiol-disulfide oxidoreductase YuxK
MSDPCAYADFDPPRRSLLRDLVDFWVRPVRAESVALFRILIAGGLLINALVTVLPNLLRYLGPEGMLPVAAMDDWLRTTGRFSVYRGPTGIPFVADLLPAGWAAAWAEWGASAGGAITLFCLWIAALAAMCVGFYTRTATILAWVLTVSFHNRASWLLNGGDAVFRNAIFYLMFAPAGAAWSIDSLRRGLAGYRDPADGFDRDTGRRERAPILVPPWSLRLMQIHLCFIYVFSGLAKVPADDWLNGEAVYWAINDLALTRWPYAWLPVPLWLCKSAGWATLVFEIGFPLMMLTPRLRRWGLWAGVVLHVGILAAFEIGWFSIVMVSWYALFVPGASVAEFFSGMVVRFNPRTWRVYYDTFCPLCRRAKRMLEDMDLGGRLEFRDIHDRPAMEADVPGVSYTQALREMIVVSPAGRVTTGFDGFRALTRVLPAMWPLRPLMYLPGAAWIGRRVYRWVARRRFRLVKCDNEVCSLHLRALSQPNLDEAEIGRIVQAAREQAFRKLNVAG